METLGQRWLKRIPNLADEPLRVAAVRAEMMAATSEEVAAALDEICQRADAASLEARVVLAAVVPVLTALKNLELVEEVRRAAATMPAAARLLRASNAGGHAVEDAPDADALQRHILQGRDGRAMTLGERRALARRPTRTMLKKLLRDPHPHVVRILLRNPRITEDDVVTMAARRPAAPAVAREIAQSWILRPRVRMALVLNPGTPPAVAVPVLALLARTELHQVANAADVPAVVRAAALELCALRSPLAAENEPPSLTH